MELPFYNRKFSVEHNQDSVLFNTKIGVKVGLKDEFGGRGESWLSIVSRGQGTNNNKKILKVDGGIGGILFLLGFNFHTVKGIIVKIVVIC